VTSPAAGRSREDLVQSARTWAIILDLGRKQLELARGEPTPDHDLIRALALAAGAVQRAASDRLRLLALHGLDAVADNIRTTAAAIAEPGDSTIPWPLRLAEAALDLPDSSDGAA
jgi:hypothetical protein